MPVFSHLYKKAISNILEANKEYNNLKKPDKKDYIICYVKITDPFTNEVFKEFTITKKEYHNLPPKDKKKITGFIIKEDFLEEDYYRDINTYNYKKTEFNRKVKEEYYRILETMEITPLMEKMFEFVVKVIDDYKREEEDCWADDDFEFSIEDIEKKFITKFKELKHKFDRGELKW